MASINIYAYNVSKDRDDLKKSGESFQDLELNYPSLYFMEIGTNGTAQNITVGEKCILRNKSGNLIGATVSGTLTAVGGQTSQITLKANSNATLMSNAKVEDLTLETGAKAQLYGCTVKNVTVSSGADLNIYNNTVIDGLALADNVTLNMFSKASLTLKGKVDGKLVVNGGTLNLDEAELSQNTLDLTMKSLSSGPALVKRSTAKISLNITVPYTGFSYGDYLLVDGPSDSIESLILSFTDESGENLGSFETGKILMFTDDLSAGLAVRKNAQGICFSVSDSLDIYLTTAGNDYFLLDEFAASVALHNAPSTINGVYAVMPGVNAIMDETTATTCEFSTGSAACVELDEDGKADVIFATAIGTWDFTYHAENTITGDKASLNGLNRFGDVIIGSDDKTAIVLSNGNDAFFADDIYTQFPDSTVQARFYGIDAIYAGDGDDLVDLTCCSVREMQEHVSIHGGAGNDILWAGIYNADLYGDEGNDTLIGGSGDDLLCGGSGNDLLCGFTGNNTYLFEANWGNDTIILQQDENFLLEFGENITSEMLIITYEDNTATISCADDSILIQNIADNGLDGHLHMLAEA